LEIGRYYYYDVRIDTQNGSQQVVVFSESILHHPYYFPNLELFALLEEADQQPPFEESLTNLPYDLECYFVNFEVLTWEDHYSTLQTITFFYF
jgi:hypothetical protein